MKQLKIKVTFIEPVLGSTNNNPNISTDFNKPAPTPEKQKEEQEALKNANKFSASQKQDDMRSTGGTILAEAEEEETVEKKQTTVFPRSADGTVFHLGLPVARIS